MPGASRLGDRAQAMADAHGCPACPHTVSGPAVQGSPDVTIDHLPAVRLGDLGVHAACCGPNLWHAAAGSGTVMINGMPAVRQGDSTAHCGGQGSMIEGSTDVFIGG